MIKQRFKYQKTLLSNWAIYALMVACVFSFSGYTNYSDGPQTAQTELVQNRDKQAHKRSCQLEQIHTLALESPISKSRSTDFKHVLRAFHKQVKTQFQSSLKNSDFSHSPTRFSSYKIFSSDDDDEALQFQQGSI